MLNTDTPWIFGHRGAAGLAPENTLAGVRRALDLGVDGIEIDVQLAHDQLWLLHDTTLERTTNGRGTLADHSFDALKALDAGGGESLPTLSELLALMPADRSLNIELKGNDTGAPTAAALHGLTDPPVLVTSFKWAELRAYREAGGEAPIGVLSHRLTDAVVQTARDLDAWSVNLGARWLTRSAVSRVRAAGFKVLVFTVNDPAVAVKHYGWGVDGFFTDFPDRVSRDALRDLPGSPAHPDG